MKTTTRRKFLKNSVLATAAVSLSAKSYAQVSGANSDIRVGVIGFRGRGKNHIDGFSRLKGVRLVALCDVDQSVLDRGVASQKTAGNDVTGYRDFRDLLDNKDIDVISTATPNHQHSLITILGCQAGKDVYVEKPVSHNVWEGRQMVNAARHYGKIVQTGTQSRSNPGMREAIAYLHEGNLGNIKLARGLCYKRRKSIGKVNGAQPVPAGIDYDLWCGPAPKVPLRRTQLHYDWHWVFDTGNGDLGNQGIHQMDIARWALGKSQLSPRVFSIGGRVGYDDDGNTPNTQIVYHDFDGVPLIFEVRGLGAYGGQDTRPEYRGASIGVVVDCDNGYMVIPTYDSAIAYDHAGNVLKKFSGGGDHFANFIDGVRSRKSSDLNADIEEGHYSSALCHTGNISYLCGEPSSPGVVMERLKGDSLLSESYGRMMEHLSVNGVDLNLTPLTVGEMLTMNPETERFTNHSKANQMLSREYRKPFIVPSIAV